MNILDHNLLAQFIYVIGASIASIFICESYGYSLTRLLTTLTKAPLSSTLEEFGFTLRVFLGGLTYALTMFGIGLFGGVYKPVVIGLSALLPVATFILGKRWRDLGKNRLRALYQNDKYIIWGALSLLILTLIMWFRPVTSFDAMWYHLTIPKLILDNHSIANQGVLVLYSLQPTLNYLWDLLPLSMPTSTAVAGIVISTVQALLLIISLIFATKIGRNIWGWSKWQQFAAPLFVGGSYITMTQLGSGGNDIAGLAYGLVAALFIFYVLRKQSLSWLEFTIGSLMVVSLASIKIFFAFFAALLLGYLVFSGYSKLPGKHGRLKLIKLLASLLLIFVVTYLPWIIRSYHATGRPLDPLGSPGFNASVYANEGGGTALNHWTNYVFTRFSGSIWPILTYVYSPLVLVGVFAIIKKGVREKVANLWLVSFFGLWIVYFLDIALQWRYFLPSTTILAFIGFAALVGFIKEFDNFGKLLIWGFLSLFLFASVLRTIVTPVDSTNAPTINGHIYLTNFTNTDDYLRLKLADLVHDYNQETSPAGLKPEERIFVGNVYWHEILAVGIHNMSYINNPMLEPSVDKSKFANIASSEDLVKLLRGQGVRFAISRTPITDVCRVIGAADYTNCDTIFTKVLEDKTWGVTWYRLKNS